MKGKCGRHDSAKHPRALGNQCESRLKSVAVKNSPPLECLNSFPFNCNRVCPLLCWLPGRHTKKNKNEALSPRRKGRRGARESLTRTRSEDVSLGSNATKFQGKWQENVLITSKFAGARLCSVLWPFFLWTFRCSTGTAHGPLSLRLKRQIRNNHNHNGFVCFSTWVWQWGMPPNGYFNRENDDE